MAEFGTRVAQTSLTSAKVEQEQRRGALGSLA
jgi:hypothetical protein